MMPSAKMIFESFLINTNQQTETHALSRIDPKYEEQGGQKFPATQQNSMP